MGLCNILENAFTLNREYQGEIINTAVIELNAELIKNIDKPRSILFTKMIASSLND